MRIAVIGGGISGLSIAQLLKNEHEVTVFETQKEAGGLIKCERVNDCLYHKVGGHVFNSKNEEVLNWFWSFFDKEKEFVEAKRNAKILIQNKIVGYPLENHLFQLEKKDALDIINELLFLSKLPSKNPFQYDNFHEYLINTFGSVLYKKYFEPYNKKIWQTDLRTISMEWLEGKLPMPNLSQILINNILREEETKMVHALFYYPRYNGSQFIVNKLRKDINLTLSAHIDRITSNDKEIILNNTHYFDKVIYTGDIRRLVNMAIDIFDENNIDISAVFALKSNGTSTVFCETDDTDISWLYIPESFTKAHRIIYTGNFSNSNNNGSLRTTCVVEFSGYLSYDEMKAEILKLPGNLNPLSHNYEANSYVIQTKFTKSLIETIKSKLSSRGIYLLGRFSEWEYYNMDKAIEAAIGLKKQLNTEFYSA